MRNVGATTIATTAIFALDKTYHNRVRILKPAQQVVNWLKYAMRWLWT